MFFDPVLEGLLLNPWGEPGTTGAQTLGMKLSTWQVWETLNTSGFPTTRKSRLPPISFSMTFFGGLNWSVVGDPKGAVRWGYKALCTAQEAGHGPWAMASMGWTWAIDLDHWVVLKHREKYKVWGILWGIQGLKYVEIISQRFQYTLSHIVTFEELLSCASLQGSYFGRDLRSLGQTLRGSTQRRSHPTHIFRTCTVCTVNLVPFSFTWTR